MIIIFMYNARTACPRRTKEGFKPRQLIKLRGSNLASRDASLRRYLQHE